MRKKAFIIAMIALLPLVMPAIESSRFFGVTSAKMDGMLINPLNCIRANGKAAILNVTPTQIFTTNYAGYAAIRPQNDFTDARGEWVVPDITGSVKPSMVDMFVGIGGVSEAGGIIQVGTELSRGWPEYGDVYRYRSWYENFPADAEYGPDITPGHSFHAMVWQVGANLWHVQLTDTTTDTTIIDLDVDTSAHPPNQRDADWIVECRKDPTKEIPNVGTITFRNCKASVGGGTAQPMGTYSPQNFEIIKKGVRRTTTSAISVDGTSFSVSVTPFVEVGGFVVPVDKFGLLAPYFGLASTILVATVATSIYVKHIKRRKEKQ